MSSIHCSKPGRHVATTYQGATQGSPCSFVGVPHRSTALSSRGAVSIGSHLDIGLPPDRCVIRDEFAVGVVREKETRRGVARLLIPNKPRAPPFEEFEGNVRE